MPGFAKLFSTIITSSVWSARDKVRIMWITVLAIADANGYVSASVPGLADIARMSVEDAQAAVDELCAPDPFSRSKEHEGRRLIPCEGGWLIVNYRKYREHRDSGDRRQQNREAQQRWRERQRKAEKPRPDKRKAPAKNGKFDLDSTEFKLAQLLFDLIRERKPDHKPPNLQSWAKDIDLMIRRDHRAPERIRQVMEWAQHDTIPRGNGFCWANNILSASKLREKFDRLELDMGTSVPAESLTHDATDEELERLSAQMRPRP